MRRTTHDLSLTVAGAELLADARQLLDEWEALEEKHLETKDVMRGRLKVVAPIALGQLHLLDTVLKFQKEYPSISLSWQLEDGDIRFAELGCDCWVKIGPVSDDSLQVEPLGQVERMVVAAPALIESYGKLNSPNRLAELPCVALSPFEGGRIPLANEQGTTVIVAPPVRMVTNNISAVRQATLAGLGFSVMPRWFVEQALEQQQLVDILPKWRAPKLTINVASLPGRHRPRRLQSFLDVLKEAVPQILGVK